MKAIQPYLAFNGNCREAMTFYQKALGGTLDVQTFGDVKAPGPADLVIHARIATGGVTLMASDSMPNMPYVAGTNVSVTIDCDTVVELDTLFAAFSEGGTVTMPVGDTFWNARFGMLTDKFGIHWMFNCYLPPKT